MSVHLAPVGMGVHVWMKRMDFTASVLRVLSPLTVTPRWTSVAAAHVSMAYAGMTSTGMNFYSLCHSLKWLTWLSKTNLAWPPCKLVANPTGFNLYVSSLLFHFYNLTSFRLLTGLLYFQLSLWLWARMGGEELWLGQEWLFAESLPECWHVHRPAQWLHLQVSPRFQRWEDGIVA